MKKTVASDKWLVASEPQSALLDPPALHRGGPPRRIAPGCRPALPRGCELPEFIAERRARVAASQRATEITARNRQIAASPDPPAPDFTAQGLEQWRAQSAAADSARYCALLLAILLLGGIALIGAAAVAAGLGWLD